MAGAQQDSALQEERGTHYFFLAFLAGALFFGAFLAAAFLAAAFGSAADFVAGFFPPEKMRSQLSEYSGLDPVRTIGPLMVMVLKMKWKSNA